MQAKVSRSGFYEWRQRSEVHDCEFEVDLITLIFEAKKRKAGARTLKMILFRDFEITMNLKKIRRIKHKFGLETVIRRKNKYTWSGTVGENHQTVPNYLEREFSDQKQDEAYSTDITYLTYGNGQRAYLSAIKDLSTREILHYHVSRTMTLDLAMNGIEDFYRSLPVEMRRNLIVHSDQGCHYTSNSYRSLLEELEILQSMSRRGNCLDNAPIESFFGHMKDELDLHSCRKYEDLVVHIDKFINFYNTERPQWGLKSKTPAECRRLK